MQTKDLRQIRLETQSGGVGGECVERHRGLDIRRPHRGRSRYQRDIRSSNLAQEATTIRFGIKVARESSSKGKAWSKACLSVQADMWLERCTQPDHTCSLREMHPWHDLEQRPTCNKTSNLLEFPTKCAIGHFGQDLETRKVSEKVLVRQTCLIARKGYIAVVYRTDTIQHVVSKAS